MDDRTWTGTAISVAVGGYSIANVTLMLLSATSKLGPVPFELIFFLIGLSFTGAMLMLPAYIAFRRSGFRGFAALSCAVALAGIGTFDLWCLYSASAAV